MRRPLVLAALAVALAGLVASGQLRDEPFLDIRDEVAYRLFSA